MGSTPVSYTTVGSGTTEILIPWDALDKHWEGAPYNDYHDSIDIRFIDYAGNVGAMSTWPRFYWESGTLESDGYLDAYPYTSLREQWIIGPYGSADDDFIGIYTTYATKGDALVVKTDVTAYTITVKHGTGNIRLLGGADLVMVPDVTYLVLQYNGSEWVQVSETADSGPGTGLVGAIVGPNGDYPTLAAALTAAETVIILDEGTHTVTGSSETIPRGTTVMGQGIDKSIVTCSDATATLVVQEGAVLQDLTVKNTYASAVTAVSSPYWVTYTDYVELYRVKIEATAGTADAYVTDTETRLHDCILISAGGYGLSAENDSDVEVYGGWIEGATYDIEAVSGCDVRLYNLPKLANGAVTGTGALHGWFQDAAGELYGYDDPLLDMVEMAADPSTPATGRWRVYFKPGGIYVIDDGGTVTGPLGTGGGGGGWPFSGKVLTVDTTDSDAAYPTIAAAIAAATTGDVILLSAESIGCVNQTLPDGVHLVGQGVGATILTNSTSQFVLQVGDGSLVANLTINHTYTSNQGYPVYMHTDADTSTFLNVEVIGSTGAYNCTSFYLRGDSTLINCGSQQTSTAYNKCVIAGDGGFKRVVGGYWDSDAGSSSLGFDEFNNPGGTGVLLLDGPVCVQGNIDTQGTGTGTTGEWYDISGILHLLGPQVMTQLASAPSTPATGNYALYFKSGGLYHKDSAGSEVGPLGTGGADEFFDWAW